MFIHIFTKFPSHSRIADEYCGGAAVTKFPKAPRGVECGEGCPLPTGEGHGEAPSQNFFLILDPEMAFFWRILGVIFYNSAACFNHFFLVSMLKYPESFVKNRS